MKKALITGITGQDGSYLAEYLLSIGYEVFGIKRRSSTLNTNRIDHIYKDPHEENLNLHLFYGDLQDSGNTTELIYDIMPHEIYHFGAQSHVRVSFDMPEYTGDVTALGTTRILEAIRRSGSKAKFYQASSSELFGSALPPQNEKTPFEPQSPYAIAKLYAYWITVNYRQAFNIFASNGILFNHESPRRGETFVTRKVSRGISKILSGEQKALYMGNLDAKRDWGFAAEYVVMTHDILQLDHPDDIAIGTGESHTVRDFIESSLAYCDIEIEWKGEGVDETGIIKSLDENKYDTIKPGDVIIRIDSRYFRPTEVNYLLADISKATKLLNWEPKIKFDSLVKIMMDYDLAVNKVYSKNEGRKILSDNGFDWTDNSYYERTDW